jgi:hypothetical protein
VTSSRSPALQTITTVLTKRTKPSLPDCRAKLKVRASASHCEKPGAPNHIRPEACERHARETVTQVDGQ